MEVAKVISHIRVSRLVFLICSRRGESTRATREEEKSTSTIAMCPSRVSNVFVNGSVLNRRKPRDVPVRLAYRKITVSSVHTHSQVTIVLVEGHEIHGHDCRLELRSKPSLDNLSLNTAQQYPTVCNNQEPTCFFLIFRSAKIQEGHRGSGTLP